MSYIREKFGVNLKQQIKNYLTEEGFKPYNEVNQNDMEFFAQSEQYDVKIEVDLDDQEIEFYVDYRYGGGTVVDASIFYNRDFDDFEEKYKNIVDQASFWME
ncbi:hypothetical protein EVJ32_04930 [Exiguobacterium sp. SH5S4]|uniref:hypothetical protein n=1 Tax=Exiguobacterium sp. SH5S4 TaxID=2510961 RepID=UPI00104020F1|nr:hypothetical protein [Exiguobacterium sp. SH5S4]TCI26721.1 hypothetical protein EVJ32_04930 [Exiguobacterium sp. SH5S4]